MLTAAPRAWVTSSYRKFNLLIEDIFLHLSSHICFLSTSSRCCITWRRSPFLWFMGIYLVPGQPLWPAFWSSLHWCAFLFSFSFLCVRWVHLFWSINSQVRCGGCTSQCHKISTAFLPPTNRMAKTWPRRPPTCGRPGRTSRLSHCATTSSSRRRRVRIAAMENTRWWWRKPEGFDHHWWQNHCLSRCIQQVVTLMFFSKRLNHTYFWNKILRIYSGRSWYVTVIAFPFFIMMWTHAM